MQVVLAGESGASRVDGWRDSGGRSRPFRMAERPRPALLSRAIARCEPQHLPEPFGLVGLEAAAFGVPAVAFDVGGIGEWLTHDVNGRLVDLAGGPGAFGDAIAAVLATDALRARLSAGARDASRHFSADAHMTHLEQVLEGRARPSRH